MNLGCESETVEFKRSTGEHREAVESMTAMLNKHGRGTLYFGVRNDGEVIGQDVTDKTLRAISQEIANKVEPKIVPSIEALDTDDGLKYIKVSFSGTCQPYACDGRYRIRQADEDVLMSSAQVREAFLDASERDRPWDGQLSGRPVSDVDVLLLGKYVHRGVRARRIPSSYEGFEDPNDILEHLGLAKDGILTNAASVLFCSSADYGFRLTMGVLDGNDTTSIMDLQQETGPVISLIDEGERYVVSNIRRRIVIGDGTQRTEIPEIPRAAIREAIINAFCHERYRDGGRVFVRIYTDAVEITNFGRFPLGTTPEDYLMGREKGSHSRNPLIANVLFRGDYIEAFGSGIHRIKEVCDDAGVRLEYFQERDETRVVFQRPWSQVEFVSGDRVSTLSEAVAEDGIDRPARNRAIQSGEIQSDIDEPQKSSGDIDSEVAKKWRNSGDIDSEVAKKWRKSGDIDSEVAKTGHPFLNESERSIVRYLETHGSAKTSQIARAIGLSPSGTRKNLSRLVQYGLVISEGEKKGRTYWLARSTQDDGR